MGTPFMNDDEEEEQIIERRNRDAENGKVENDENIPLIPNVKSDTRKTIHAIQIWKMDPPNDGLKGSVPPFTNHETIAKLFGNGVFDFYAVTIDGKILRRHTGVKVSLPPPTPENSAKTESQPLENITAHMRLLEWQSKQYEKDSARVESFGRMAVEHTREFSTQQLQTMRTETERQAERDRIFFSQQAAQTNQFFAAMFQQAQQIHAQAMERQREDHRQTIQMLTVTNQRAAEANDPRTILGLLREGMALAQLGAPADDEEDEEKEDKTPVWASAIKEGAAAVKDITETYKLKAFADANNSGTNPMKAITQGAAVQAPAKQLAKPGRRLPFTPNQVKEMARLAAICKQRGLDFDVMLRNASQYFASGGPTDAGEQQSDSAPEPDDSHEPAETDSSEARQADLDS